MDRRALLIVVAICAAAMLAVFGVIQGGAYLNDLALRDEKAQTVKEAGLTLEAFETHSLDLVRYVDVYLLALRAAYQHHDSVGDARNHLSRVPFNAEMIDAVSIVDADGQVLLTSGDALGSHADERDFFVAQRDMAGDQLFFSSVTLAKAPAKQVFQISRRLTNAEGAFAGVVVASIDPASFARFYRDLRLGQQSTVALLSSKDHRLRARFPLPSAEQWSFADSASPWAKPNAALAGAYEAVDRFDGISRTYAYKTLAAYPLTVVVGFSELDVKARLLPQEQRQKISEFILVGFVVAIALLILAVAVNRQRLAKANRDLQGVYEQMRGMALFDALTGLPNRNLLEDRLLQALLDSERNEECCALIYLDLDDFKVINDTIGHDAGDHVLEVTASRMLAAVRATDTVSRRGGDEFVILLPHAGTLSEILEVADRLIHWIAEPIQFKGTNCAVSASVGVAIYPGDGNTPEEMLKAADDAMYMAKRKGKKTIVLASDKIVTDGAVSELNAA